MRPKLRTLIVDVYRDVSYALDDDGYTTAEYQDLVRKRFVKAWEGLIDGYKVGVRSDWIIIQRTNSSVGRLYRVELSIVLRPRNGCDSETLGKGCTQLEVYRGSSLPLVCRVFLNGDDSWAQYGSTGTSVRLRRTSLRKPPLGMLARSLRGCSRYLPFLTSIAYVDASGLTLVPDDCFSTGGRGRSILRQLGDCMEIDVKRSTNGRRVKSMRRYPIIQHRCTGPPRILKLWY